MPPEIKIILYVSFVACLFIIKDMTAYAFIFIVIIMSLSRIPLKSLKRGWIPISLFLLFTFISNALFQHGRILYIIGPVIITQEGLTIASVRTMRVFFMIAGAKLLTATTPIEQLVAAFGNMLKPLEKLGIPVVEFFMTTGLTMKALPGLKNQIALTYREKIKENNITGFRGRARVISMFLLPLFIKSLQSPEMFFNDSDMNRDAEDKGIQNPNGTEF
ncbi:MAG: energy-coupling factor transporter transmembrane component T [Nitrospirota bacterium]